MKRKDPETLTTEPKLKKVSGTSNTKEEQKSKIKSSNKNAKVDAEANRGKKGKFEKASQIKKFGKTEAGKKFEKTGKNKGDASKNNAGKPPGTENGEKPDWLEFKKQKKELKEQRKAKKLTDAYDVTVKAKKIGEKLRRDDCTQENKDKLTDELYDLLKGQFSKTVFTHDISRVIQWLLKYCKPEVREAISQELKDSVASMLLSKYAKNCVKTMLKYGSNKIRALIIAACNGHVIKLVSHAISAPIVEYAFASFATQQDKIHFKQEFYGDMYKQAKDPEVKTLADTYKTSADMKTATLGATKANIVKILNKKLINSTLLHTVIYEFLTNCSSEDASEIIVMLHSLIVELCQTKDGTKVAMICLWKGTTKDRKTMLKSLKGHIKDLATNEHGHLALLALFDCVDDTVLVKKLILSELLNDLTEIAVDEYGRQVVLYLVARRDPHYFHPKIIEEFQQGYDNSSSKKAADVREKELRDACIDSLLKSVATDTMMWLSSSSICMVTLAILKAGDGETLVEAHEGVSDYLTNSESVIVENEVSYKAIEYAGLHMMLKKLIQNDKILVEKEKPTFGEVLIRKLEAQNIKEWIEYNRGCFLLITLIENEAEASQQALKSKLKPFVKSLQSKKTPGASILLKKLK